MEFEIPENINRFSVQGLRELQAEANEAHAALLASVTPDTVTDEQLAQLEALKTFTVTIDEKITADATAQADAEARAARFSAASQTITTPAPAATTVGNAAEVTVTEVTQTGPEHGTEHSHTAEPGSALSALRISDLGPDDVSQEPAVLRAGYATLIAAADVPGVPAGQPLDMAGFARAFLARTASHAAMGNVQGEIVNGVAVIQRNYPAELSVFGDQRDEEILANVVNESRLPGGSLRESARLRYQELGGDNNPDALVAASGWCAPSETDYSICMQITTDGLLDTPEVQARRGGIRHNTGLDFGTVYGSGTGFFNLSEAEVAAGTQKTCLEIPCPDFTDDRLGVTGVCLTGNLLAIRGYPEYTEAFTRGAMAVSAHQVNSLQIAAMVTGSTAVTLSGAPWASDGTVVSQVFSAVEMAIVDIKYRLRLQRNATLEVVLPFWLLAQMRADFIRRNGGDYAFTPGLADSQIMAWFNLRGARVQFVYDWQDAFSTAVTAGSPGSTTPISALPTSLQFLVYPAGTWVRAVSDVITLNSVYDSTKLVSNQVTHLFTETGWKMMRMCPVSRVYTIAICPSGETTSTQSVTC